VTALLASVTGPDEARIALSAGADIIDLKNPKTGALGALPIDVIESAVRLIDSRRPCSATVGDLPSDPEILSTAVQSVAATGVDYVKVGFFENEKLAPCLEALSDHAQRSVRLVAVLFADLNPDLDILDEMAARGFAGVMLDTANKINGNLRRHISERQLEGFIHRAKNSNLLTGLAGSLSTNDIPSLLRLQPDYLGFRAALCDRRQRTADIDKNAILSVKSQMSKSSFVDLSMQNP
jgi:dihydroneopterin aldolase